MTEQNVFPTILAQRLFHLRALVLALGESASPVWWRTGFMNETGLRFLERLYPRTFFNAAVHAAGKAATETHDKAVGRVGVYHLFRLPETLEIEINRMSLDSDQEFISLFRTRMGQSDKLLELLSGFFQSQENIGDLGPRRIGAYDDLNKTAYCGKMAAFYYYAFSEGKPGFPYFTNEKKVGNN